MVSIIKKLQIFCKNLWFGVSIEAYKADEKVKNKLSCHVAFKRDENKEKIQSLN